MYELKTKVNTDSVVKFIGSVDNPIRRKDSIKLLGILEEIFDEEPRMWGDSIIGFGDAKYSNSQKKEYDWFKVGFSPRKNSLSLYLVAYSEYIYKLADRMNLKHGKGCVYIKDLSKVDKGLIKEMIMYSLKEKNNE